MGAERMFHGLSFRYKVPLNLAAAILFTSVVVALMLIWRSYGDVREEFYRDAAELGKAIAEPLAEAMKHDDPWRAYRILRALHSDATGHERSLVLLDEEGRVFVASQARRYPMRAQLRELGAEETALGDTIAGRRGRVAPYKVEPENFGKLYVVVPLIEEGVARGTLLVAYPETIFRPALERIVQRVTLSSLLVMGILLPVAWYVGNRTVTPLMDLAQRMRAVGRAPMGDIEEVTVAGDDEIGMLARRFNQMVQELQDKESLERQVVVSERLAAVGRLVAGVAHEVNNPLGGMLNAINTYRRYGKADERTEKTIALLERGLGQIKNTVSALLVEAKAEWHGLTPQDIDDVRTLIQPDVSRRRLTLQWENGLQGTLAVPATPVRQMLINLSLNAVEASSEGGSVKFRIGESDGRLDILICNEGEQIPEEEMGQLFEPFASTKAGGSGLGLWVTYQIVHQLEGEILVVSEEGTTSFEVRVPLKEAA